MTAPITYYGGKTKMLADIERLYIDTGRYVEPFAGGASFFWHKKPSEIEVIGDTNGMVTNFYRVIKSPKMLKELSELAEGTVYSEFAWEEARYIYSHPGGYSKPERAWAFWMLYNCSFGGMGAHGAFQITCHQNDSWVPPVGLNNKKRKLKYYGDRMKRVMILTKSALEVIVKFDSPETYFYLDPPYWQASQGPYKGYTLRNFQKLLELCSKMKGKFLLSSYACELLKDYVDQNNWNQILLDKTLAVSSNGDRKVESLVFNYDEPAEVISNSLF